MKQNPYIYNITWDRIWISFYIKGITPDKCVYIKSSDDQFKLKRGDSPDEFKLNITNPGNCKMLPSGIYKLFADINPDNMYDDIVNESLSLKKYYSEDPSENLSNNISEDLSKNHSADQSDESNASAKMEITSRILGNVKRFNRSFTYFHSERAYRIQFSQKNSFKFRASDIRLPEPSIKKRISSFIRRFRNDTAKAILRAIYNAEYILFHRKPLGMKPEEIQKIQSPRILLMSDMSEEMGSNMAAFHRALLRNGYKPDTLLRAITTKHYNILHWIKSLSKIARADFIFFDDHCQTTDWLTMKGVLITQLWHSGPGFKSTGYSRFGMPASPALKSGHRQYNYGIAGAKKVRHYFSEVWGINDEMVLPTGMPRLDEYLDYNYQVNTIKKLLQDYPVLCKLFDSESITLKNVKSYNSVESKNKKSIDTSKAEDNPETESKSEVDWGYNNRINRLYDGQVILFAPTYRGENKKHAYYPYDKLDFDRLYKLCTETDSFIIYKMHPYVAEPVPIPEQYSDRMLDLTSYTNINDLFYITDLMITDYSSGIYEFSLMRRPMLFYAFDEEEYTKERGFHRDYRENAPGKIVKTFDDLITAIENQDFEYERVEQYIENNFEFTDNHACDRIIKWIIKGQYIDK